MEENNEMYIIILTKYSKKSTIYIKKQSKIVQCNDKKRTETKRI